MEILFFVVMLLFAIVCSFWLFGVVILARAIYFAVIAIPEE